MKLLEIKGLKKTFYDAEGHPSATVSVPSLSLGHGESLILEGPSGSGKTTLLHIISGLLREDEGEILFDGARVSGIPRKERDRWRAANIGYVFQKLNLIEALTVEENIMLASKWTGKASESGDPRERTRRLLGLVGLSDRANAHPSKLSLGEQQRAAVIRAVFNRPPLLLADEPTASLDRANCDAVLGLLKDLCAEYGAAMILSTHDDDIKAQFARCYNMRTGRYSG